MAEFGPSYRLREGSVKMEFSKKCGRSLAGSHRKSPLFFDYLFVHSVGVKGLGGLGVAFRLR